MQGGCTLPTTCLLCSSPALMEQVFLHISEMDGCEKPSEDGMGRPHDSNGHQQAAAPRAPHVTDLATVLSPGDQLEFFVGYSGNKSTKLTAQQVCHVTGLTQSRDSFDNASCGLPTTSGGCWSLMLSHLQQDTRLLWQMHAHPSSDLAPARRCYSCFCKQAILGLSWTDGGGQISPQECTGDAQWGLTMQKWLLANRRAGCSEKRLLGRPA